MKPGQPERRDYEYERNGTANLFMMFAPLEGWRCVKVTDRRTAVDFAKALEDLSDRHFPNAKKIVLVQDNLNTHKPASLYEAFPPDKARRLVERFEWHYTPKHGSWLDMAESELAVLAAQCLDRRIPDKQITKSPLGRLIATSITPKPTGSSRPMPPAISKSRHSRPFLFYLQVAGRYHRPTTGPSTAVSTKPGVWVTNGAGGNPVA
jgi:DDE superfamily endonuclease